MSNLDEVYKKLKVTPKAKKEEPVKEIPDALPETDDDLDEDEAEEEPEKKESEEEPVKEVKSSGKKDEPKIDDESKSELSEQIEIFHNDGLFRQQLLVRLDEQNKALKAIVAILYRLIGGENADK